MMVEDNKTYISIFLYDFFSNKFRGVTADWEHRAPQTTGAPEPLSPFYKPAR